MPERIYKVRRAEGLGKTLEEIRAEVARRMQQKAEKATEADTQEYRSGEIESKITTEEAKVVPREVGQPDARFRSGEFEAVSIDAGETEQAAAWKRGTTLAENILNTWDRKPKSVDTT
ncbi:hypothetical protein HYT59_00085 [Candidatus Woesebacteria bacterium]|nr:hypothetical protein [Candidatus Woesebacteria bacterium]